MASTRRITRSPLATATAGASWMALIAATTLGGAPFQRVRAEVSADPRQLDDSVEGYRLIVQSYESKSVRAATGLPSAHARPLASTQRAITREELARGVAVDVVGLEDLPPDAPVIVAWVERGRPDLEFDALGARPPADGCYAAASADTDTRPALVLRRHVAFG
jgi:hypothetical protein